MTMTPRVAVVGLCAEAPCQLLLDALGEEDVEVYAIDQQAFERWPLQWSLDEHGLSGRFSPPDGREPVPVDTLSGVYLRPLDGPAAWGQNATRGQALQQWINGWVELTEVLPCRVANPASAMSSNASKPYQTQLLAAAGFHIPPTLITNCPEQVLAFEAEQGDLIFKSASGVRSIVRALDQASKQRLELVRHCPAMFQKKLTGTNVRVHVVGQQTFCAEVDCASVDYRYGSRDGEPATLRSTALPADLRWRCIQVAHQLGLPFAGLDLLLGEDGLTYCFEVNPSPGYSYFENATGAPIARELGRWLAGMQP